MKIQERMRGMMRDYGDCFDKDLQRELSGRSCIDAYARKRLVRYFKEIAVIKVDVEANALKHSRLTLWAVRYLKKKKGPASRLAREMLKMKLAYASKVRSLA